MIIQFKFSNFRSFKDEALLSMEQTSLRETKEELGENSFEIDATKYKLLKTAVIYGANASGKSNIFKAMTFFRNFTITSTYTQDKIPVESFRLNTSSMDKPSLFEMMFIINQKIYRYGFSCNSEKIYEEWLYERSILKNAKEKKIFTRKEQQITRGYFFKEGKEVEDKTRNNTLFLSALSQWNSPLAQQILEYIKSIAIIDLSSPVFVIGEDMFESNNNVSAEILKYLQMADFSIESMIKSEKNVDENNPEDRFAINLLRILAKGSSNNLKKIEIHTTHKVFDLNHNEISKTNFELSRSESMGTIKFVTMIGLVTKHLSQKNGVIFADELDSSLHPLLLEYIIKMFNSSKINKSNSQLIFSVHNVEILNNDLFRRDQIWFADKNKFEESSLYSLADFKTTEVRKTQNFAKNYLFGRYGAVPQIKSF
ncbi:MAG: ATP-binding protein [Thermotogae bacterium]|jgi:AAA15 family ATPase/GTPase|nr:ATP-binding protein [Thermotogota bacterium]